MTPPGVRPSCLQSKSVFALHVLPTLSPRRAAVLVVVREHVCSYYDKKLQSETSTRGHRGRLDDGKRRPSRLGGRGGEKEEEEEDVRQEVVTQF